MLLKYVKFYLLLSLFFRLPVNMLSKILTTMNDEEFLKKFKKGERVLKKYAMVLTGDKTRATELYQQTVVRAYVHRNCGYAIANFTHWMGVLMRELYQDDMLSHDGNISVKSLPKHTEQLPEEIRRVVQLAASGCSSCEIAKMLGLTRLTVKNRICATKRMAGK